MLIADSVGKSFKDRRILSSARLEVRTGEVAGLLGRMGTGKSTLLKICAGRITPDSGWVELNGVRFDRPSAAKLARCGLFYLGELDNLAWTRTPIEHFDEIERRFGSFHRDSIVERFAIGDLLERRVNQLSGGETRRIEMAIAFARRPLVLLFDEPFRGADPKLCHDLGTAFRELASKGTAIVVTGHEVNMLMPFLDSVVWMTSGTTYHLGSPDEAASNEMFAKDYLGSIADSR